VKTKGAHYDYGRVSNQPWTIEEIDDRRPVKDEGHRSRWKRRAMVPLRTITHGHPAVSPMAGFPVLWWARRRGASSPYSRSWREKTSALG